MPDSRRSRVARNSMLRPRSTDALTKDSTSSAALVSGRMAEIFNSMLVSVSTSPPPFVSRQRFAPHVLFVKDDVCRGQVAECPGLEPFAEVPDLPDGAVLHGDAFESAFWEIRPQLAVSILHAHDHLVWFGFPVKRLERDRETG